MKQTKRGSSVLDDYLLDQIDDAYWDAEESGDWINFHAQSQLSSKLDDVLDAAYKSVKKANVPQEQWQDFALQLAKDALHSRRKERYAEICARENWHQRLMDYVNRGLDIRTLNEYEDLLLASHRHEVIDFYIRYIWHVMEGYRCRATYKDVCRYLRHIYRLGAGQQVVIDIANELRTKYRRCPALLEELDRLSFIHS